ncbi:MAG: DnaA/Hda family protein [Parvularcula sp.]|jgi:chromosomal replication initiator protein|nr:DnaA/Hda family protein [Parvularcula sp.]
MPNTSALQGHMMQDAQTTQQLSDFKSELKKRFGPAIYESYFVDLSLAESSEEDVVFCAPTRFSASLISQRFGSHMHRMWSERYQPVRRFRVLGAQDVNGGEVGAAGEAAVPQRAVAAGGRRSYAAPTPSTAMTAPSPQKAEISFDSEETGIFAQGMTLERFCTNETNTLARRAVMKVLDTPNAPVTTIYGASGRGKTHLLNAIGHEWLKRNPSDNVLYLTYDALMTDVSEAFISKSVKELRAFLRNTDLLLIDDIQLLRGRKRTQEELDCLIDKLRGVGKRVIVAASMPPSQLAETGISARLASRLAGGLSVPVERPDLDLRMKIAAQFAREAAQVSGIGIAQRHLEYIARRCEDSIRELEGTLSYVQVVTEAEADAGQMLTDERLRRVVAEQLSRKKPILTPEAVLAYTSEVFEISKDEITGRSRKQPIVQARHAFCMAVRKLLDTPLTAIGAMIGRDHTTIMHSVKAAEILAETNAVFGGRITQIFDEFEQVSGKTETPRP